jgi:hypothetical protein
MAATPTIVPGVRANRRFLGRAVRYMAEAGVRQYLDIGTAIPTAKNTHEVAQAVAPDAPGRLRGQRPLQVGLCTRALSRVGCLKRT